MTVSQEIQNYISESILFQEAKTEKELKSILTNVLTGGISRNLYEEFLLNDASFIDSGIAFSFSIQPQNKTYDVQIVITGVEFDKIDI